MVYNWPQIERSVIEPVPLFHDGFMMFENTKSDKEPPVSVPTSTHTHTHTRTHIWEREQTLLNMLEILSSSPISCFPRCNQTYTVTQVGQKQLVFESSAGVDDKSTL